MEDLNTLWAQAKPTAYPGASQALSDQMDIIDKAGGKVDFQVGPDGKVIPPKEDLSALWDKAKPIKAIEKPAETLSDKWKGVNETLTTLLTGIPAQVAGGIVGLFHAVTHPETFGTPEGVAAASRHAAEVSQGLTYQPKTETGQNILGKVGAVLDESKLAGLSPATVISPIGTGAAALKQGTRSAIKTGIEAIDATIPLAIGDAAEAINMADRMPPPAASISGIGAAETAAATMRRERAASLPTPIDLTKGQAERTFEQQKFEQETAKTAIGAPLRERYAQQNSQVLQNFDSWIDQTGAEAPTLRATGAIVDKVLVDKAQAAKNRITTAYNAAKEAGELAAPVPTDALVDYLNENRPAAINAPVLTTAEKKLIQLGGATLGKDGNLAPGTIPLNDMEEIRKLIGNVSGSDRTNIHFGSEAKQVIDSMTEGAGGDLYKRARMLRSQYAAEFENKGVIDKLMNQKPGTSDRAVALEDVFNHSMLNSSLDDVRAVRRTLQTAGPQGSQAWKELQGQTLQYLKDQATKNVATDIQGNRIVSAAALDRAILSLDKDGKLDFIFGKQGADKIRDLNSLAKDIYTAPPGAVNTSNTSSALMEALGNALVGKIPTASAKVLSVARNAINTRKLRGQINEALQGEQLSPIQQQRKALGYP
jgi:hypothetical protein